MRRVLLLLLLALVCTFAAAGEFEIHVIDVGQGDAVLIRAPNGQTALYDGGRSPQPVLRYLRRQGIGRLDLVVASHADADHIGGLVDVVARHAPRYYLDNGLPHTTATYARLLDAVAAAGSLYLEPTARTLSLGEVTLRVLPPPGDPALGQNDNSVGLIVSYGSFRAALTGDAEATEFAWWARHHPEAMTDVDLYKSSHHGSANGDTPLSVDRFRPEVVVISVGADNPYGHPSRWARRLYAAVEATVLRTDLHGTVVASVDVDGELSLRTPRAAAETIDPDAVLTRTAATVRAAIDCVVFDPDGRDDGREIVTIRALQNVDVTGWMLLDAADHRFALPPRTLTAGEALQIPNAGRPVWNNGGDIATLRDARGAAIDRFVYDGRGSVACR